MARDPFAPVVESSVPKWVWLVVGGFAIMLIGLGTTVALVLTKRPAVQAAKAGTLPQAEAPAPTPTEKPSEVAANDKPAATGDDKGEKDEPHKPKKHKSSGGSSSKKPAAEAKPAEKPAPPKPKKVMDQKDIDKLLGL
jgi:hypothetical protein